MVLGGGTVLNCPRRDIVWTWGNSNLLAGFVRSGTGWGMELSLQGRWMFWRGLIITWGTWGGIYKRMLFSPAYGHPWPSWMDPGNPGNPGQCRLEWKFSFFLPLPHLPLGPLSSFSNKAGWAFTVNCSGIIKDNNCYSVLGLTCETA